MIEITKKYLFNKFSIYSVNFLLFIFGFILISFDYNQKNKLVLLLMAMFISSFRLILEYISLYILHKNIGKTFSCIMDFQLWKYKQVFFIVKKFIQLVDVFLSLFSCIFNLSIYDELLYNTRVFLISYFVRTIFLLIYTILIEPENIYLIFHIDNESDNVQIRSLITLKNIPKLDEDCPICYENNNEKNWVELPCRHKFHNECILEWLKIKNICPVCRQEFYNLLSC